MKALLACLMLTLAVAGCTSMPPVATVTGQYEHQYPERKIVKVEMIDEHELEGMQISYRIYYTIAGDPTPKTDIWRYRKVAEGWSPAP